MKKVLRRVLFGNPVLREPARRLSVAEIKSAEIQELIADLKHTVDTKKSGVGLAAPQVGIPLAIARIAIKPTKLRPHRQHFDQVIINPIIVQTHGRRKRRWEGCLSFGTGDNTPYGETWRYPEVTANFIDEHGKDTTVRLTGLAAHVYQHELDHLNGVLFVDRLTNPSTLIMASEFKKRILPTLPKEK
jgi:peptide deformylase